MDRCSYTPPLGISLQNKTKKTWILNFTSGINFTSYFTWSELMSIEERLSAVGMTKAQFAAALGIGASSVSNMVSAGKLTERAEAKLVELEGGGESHIEPGNLVRMGDEIFRVVRRDHCVNLKGRESWIYWITPAKQVDGGYATNGQTTRCPEAFLTDLGDVEWVEFEKPDQSKGK